MTWLHRLRRWWRRRSDRQFSAEWWRSQHRREQRVPFESVGWNWDQFLLDQKSRESRQANDWIRVEIRGKTDGY